MNRVYRSIVPSLLGSLILGWLVLDCLPASAQTPTGGFPKGGTTFTPSGSGVRWPITLVPTPGRPLGVSNLMLVPAPGTPPGANLNLAPASSIRSAGSPSPGLNLGGFGSVLGGPQDLSGALSNPSLYNPVLSNPSVGSVMGEQVTTLPYGIPITGTIDTIPSSPIAPNGTPDYGASATLTNVGIEAGAASASVGRSIGYLGIGATAAPTAPFYSINAINSPPARGGLQSDVQAILNRCARLDSVHTIQVATDGDSLVLRGIVKDDHDRRLAEAIARLTPGVRELRNELAVTLATGSTE
jgi:hypothetical protein